VFRSIQRLGGGQARSVNLSHTYNTFSPWTPRYVSTSEVDPLTNQALAYNESRNIPRLAVPRSDNVDKALKLNPRINLGISSDLGYIPSFNRSELIKPAISEFQVAGSATGKARRPYVRR